LMRRLAARGRVLTAIALAAALLGGLAGARSGTAQELVTIRLAGTPDDAKTPVFYAVQTGMYRRAGLDVQIALTSSGSAATAAVVAGAYEMGQGSLLSIALAHLRGLPIAVIAIGSVLAPKVLFAALLVAADSPVKTGADMNGKTVGVPALNDVDTLSASVWVDKNGGDAKTLKFVEVSNTLAGDALAAHRIDLAVMQPPQLDAAVEAGKARVLANAAISSTPYAFSAYFANKDWAEKHPDAVRTFARVTYAAAAYTNAHPDETAAMMADVTKIPLAVFRKMARVRVATASDPSLMQPLIDAAAAYKVIPRGFPAKEMFFGG
jgi:NitT/TauT family transport system substrate-binding protein